MDHIVVDVETRLTPNRDGLTWDDTDQLGIGVAVVYEGRGQRFRVFGQEDRPQLQERILSADKISGFNIWGFDFPVIWGLSRQQWQEDSNEIVTALKQKLAPKTNDILRRIWQAQGLNADRFDKRTHSGWRLDDVARATLGAPGKIASGADAPGMFQRGEWARLVTYCCDDVALERDLTAFVERYGYVLNLHGQRVLLRPWAGA